MKKTKKNNTSTATQAAPARTGTKSATRAPKSEKTKGFRSWLHGISPTVWSVAALALLAFVVLISIYGNYMRKVEGLSLFLSTSTFFSQCMDTPGGLLTWLAAMLNQTFYYPWLGATVYTVIITALTVVSMVSFGVPKQWRPAMILPAALVLLAFTNLGYLIFSLKPIGFAFTLPVGLLVSALCCLACRKLPYAWLWPVFVALVVLVGYRLLGFYALLAAVMCVAGIALPARGGKRSTAQWIAAGVTAVVAAALIWWWPGWWFYHFDSDLILSLTYLTPLPRFYAHEGGWKLFYTCIFALYVAAALAASRMPSVSGRFASHIPVATAVIALVVVAAGRTDDANLRMTLDLDRAIWDQDWPRAVQLAQSQSEDPTRVNTVLSYIAMMRAGVAGQQMFSIIDSKSPYHTTRAASAFNDAVGPLVAYQLGLLNYAYRWATEYNIGQGMSVERLKIMTKCALLNYELDLADTYLDLLYNMPMHRDWARRYMHYRKNPVEMGGDPEFAAIIPLMCHPNEFINDGGAFESYVWPMLARGDKGTPQFHELTMQAALINRDLDTFMQKLPVYASTHPRVPRYYQEAAWLWSLLSKQPCPVPVDRTIQDAHARFLSTFRGTSQREAEDQREIMRRDFGDTYWFYYVFNDDMLLK